MEIFPAFKVHDYSNASPDEILLFSIVSIIWKRHAVFVSASREIQLS